MVAVISTQAKEFCRYLQQNGLKATSFSSEQVPSLTALLLDQEEITDMVIQRELHTEWSMGHILAAAKYLLGRGRMIFVGDGYPLPDLICVVPDKEALLELLKKPRKAKDGNTGGRQVTRDPPASSSRQQAVKITPLQIPSEKILILGVIGSQQRIGCTTQAVVLWHYCRALGFDAAVVSGAEQIAAIAGSMHHQEISGGYRIEGVPFVTNTAHTYDCYILDIAPGNIQEALRSTDYLILVAGSKPWELQHTAAALRAARDKKILVTLSFSSQSDANTLQPLFGHQTAAVLPWLPDLWHPSMEALAVYDDVLRPVLENILTKDDHEHKEEQKILEGE